MPLKQSLQVLYAQLEESSLVDMQHPKKPFLYGIAYLQMLQSYVSPFFKSSERVLSLISNKSP